MARIIPKLNLNKTPNTVENNSLIFAKNIRLDANGDIHKDYGISSILLSEDGTIDYKKLVDKVIDDVNKYIETTKYTSEFHSHILNVFKGISFSNDSYLNIVGIIPDNNSFYLFTYYVYLQFNDNNTFTYETYSTVLVYDEYEDTLMPCDCNWNWSGGTIDGIVTSNLIGDKILNIGETLEGRHIPFKCINLNKSSFRDDETLYTQTPNIPIINLSYAGRFNYVIPCGIYQFYIRYKVREDFYTDWFPASKELFAGNKHSDVTSFGTVSYCNIHADADTSFVFNVNSLFSYYEKNYESFQIGFVLSHDDSIIARAWKHFSFDQTSINFDYNANDATEMSVTDFTKPTYQLFDVGNVAVFKNKLYVSNYTESDFNEDLQDHANKVEIAIKEIKTKDSYDSRFVSITSIGTNKYISGIILNNESSKSTSISSILWSISVDGDNNKIKNILSASLNNDKDINDKADIHATESNYGFKCTISRQTLSQARNKLKKTLSTWTNLVEGPIFDDNGDKIDSIYIDDKYINPKNVVYTAYDGNKTDDKKDLLQYITNQIVYMSYKAQLLGGDYKAKNSFTIKINRTAKYTILTYDAPMNPNEFIEDDNIDTNSTRSVKAINKNDSIIEITPIAKSQTITYTQEIKITYSADISKLIIDDTSFLLNNTTLIPYQTYKFYIHFVKQNGEVTNGYYCNGDKGGEQTPDYQPIANKLLYPVFSNIIIPNGYVACFFSILHAANNVATIFNVKIPKDKTDATSIGVTEGSCIDIDMGLIPVVSKVNCMQATVTESIEDGEKIIEKGPFEGTYHYSSDSSIPRYFGANGVISFDEINKITEDNLMYAILDYETQQDIDAALIKCTPYIPKLLDISETDFDNDKIVWSELSQSYDDFIDTNLLGYICQVSSLDRDKTIEFYSDGTSVYRKGNIYQSISTSYINLNFKELNKYNEEGEFDRIRNFNLKPTSNVNIYSNYNLNYVNLSNDVIIKFASFYDNSVTGSSVTVNNDNGSTTTNSTSSTTGSVVLKIFSSQLLSGLYELQSMYKIITRKTYSQYTTDSIVKFDNSIRSSELIDDEREISIYKFNPDDIYNIPTNKGEIVNLISIGDSILVHTRDSMFRFSGSNNLSGSTGEIVTNETEPFNTGIAEIFGSDFGFAGLQDKRNSIVTEIGYIFFDKDSKIIYAYSGQGQIKKLSDKIEKLFNYDKINNVYFANDFYNDRFFMCIAFADNNTVTLSYNFLDEVKDFVSIHDFYFTSSFNTKTNCYFLTPYRNDICRINKNTYAIYELVNLDNDKMYPTKRNDITISRSRIYHNSLGIKTSGNYTTKVYQNSSIIDVIVNENYETVKTLNSLTWISRIVESFISEITNNSNIEEIMMAEPKVQEYPCSTIRVYSDTCATNAMDCTKIANSVSITDVNSYKYPRYNQGKWALNYFRNILNANDRFNYLSKYNDGRQTAYYRSDDNSLIEGKYFVIRFTFDDGKDFKLETITLDTKNKL